jgi:hypothetical protein
VAFKVQDQGIAMAGFKELNDALHRIGSRGDFGVEYEMQRRLRAIGEKVASVAPTFVTHRTQSRAGGERLEDSVKVSVTKTQASVFSTAVHAGVQNSGGGPKAGWAARGPHVRAANASHWMNEAVNSQREFVAEEMDGLVDWVVNEFELG